MKVFIMFLMGSLMLGYFLRRKDLKIKVYAVLAVAVAVCVAYYVLRQV